MQHELGLSPADSQAAHTRHLKRSAAGIVDASAAAEGNSAAQPLHSGQRGQTELQAQLAVQVQQALHQQSKSGAHPQLHRTPQMRTLPQAEQQQQLQRPQSQIQTNLPTLAQPLSKPPSRSGSTLQPPPPAIKQPPAKPEVPTQEHQLQARQLIQQQQQQGALHAHISIQKQPRHSPHATPPNVMSVQVGLICLNVRWLAKAPISAVSAQKLASHCTNTGAICLMTTMCILLPPAIL